MVTIIFIGVQNLEGLFYAPRIVGNSVGLHPMTVIVSIFIWGLLIGGLLGPLLAIPLTATIKVLLARYVWGERLREQVMENIEEVPVVAAEHAAERIVRPRARGGAVRLDPRLPNLAARCRKPTIMVEQRDAVRRTPQSDFLAAAAPVARRLVSLASLSSSVLASASLPSPRRAKVGIAGSKTRLLAEAADQLKQGQLDAAPSARPQGHSSLIPIRSSPRAS